MDDLIRSIQNSDILTQAVAVTIGGLSGVFITLFVFWAIIAVSERVGRKK